MLSRHVYVATVLLFTQHGYSQKQGDSCVIEHTNTLGYCAPATSCQSAIEELQIHGTPPTFCNHSLQTVCCSDQTSILNTAANNNSSRRPVLSNNQQKTRDNQRLSEKKGDSCVIEHTNTLGYCAPATSCQSAIEELQIHGTPPTFCNHSLQTVCCSDQTSILNTAANNNSSRRPVLSNNQQKTRDNQRLSEKKCEEYSSHLYETVDLLPLLPDPEPISISGPKCDYNGVELIVGGEDAQTGEFPHMAAIGWVNYDGTYSFLCGGSLISTKFVLTAGHCTNYSKMKDPVPVIVRLGDQNLDPSKKDGASPIEVQIKNIRKHPQYTSPGKYHDIALLELASDIDFDAVIRPACLWNKPDFPGHTKAVATGWGVVDPRTRRTSDELQKVSLSLFENDHCNYLLRFKKNRHWAVGLTANQLCAGELRGGKDTCQGDSGSPLQVVSQANKCIFHVIGVTSFGDKCAQSSSPSVYTRVSSYLDWIESVVWPGES